MVDTKQELICPHCNNSFPRPVDGSGLVQFLPHGTVYTCPRCRKVFEDDKTADFEEILTKKLENSVPGRRKGLSWQTIVFIIMVVFAVLWVLGKS